MFRKRKAQQEMEEISRMLERVLNGECIQPGEIGYEDTLPAKIRYQIRRISEKNQGVEARITRERDETKALIGEIAHQMRNPLAGVESYTQLFRGRDSGRAGKDIPARTGTIRTAAAFSDRKFYQDGAAGTTDDPDQKNNRCSGGYDIFSGTSGTESGRRKADGSGSNRSGRDKSVA